VSLKSANQCKLLLLETYKTNNSIWKAYNKHASIILFGEREPINAGSLTISCKATMIKFLTVAIVPESNTAIIPGGYQAVVERRYSIISKFTRVKGENELTFIIFRKILPQSPKGILYNPKIIFNCNPINICRFLSLWLEVDFFLWFDIEIKFLIRLTLIDSLCVPKTNISIWSSADYLFIVLFDILDVPIMTKFLRTNCHHWFY